MADTKRMTLMEAVSAYIDKFDEGPPIFEMDEHRAISLIKKAIKDGRPMEESADRDIPPGAIL